MTKQITEFEDKIQYTDKKKQSKISKFFGSLWRSKTGLVGFIIVLFVLLMAIFAPIIAPFDPQAMNPVKMLKPPIWIDGSDPEHLLGTDNLGRDILSRIIYGSQVSLLVGIASVVLAGIIGVFVGLVAE